jgi:uncharacterized protein YukJ
VNDEGDRLSSHERLIDRLEQLTEQARHDDEAELYAFGRRFGPKRGKDPWFGFEPILGVHEAHMNQGGFVPYEEGNAIWQDGATLFRFGSRAGSGEQWVVTFVVFRAQTWKTDEHGNPDDPRQDLASLVPSHPVAAGARGDRR